MVNNSIKVLILDDIQDNLISLNALIKDAFPEAITLNALNGKTGLELAAKEDPDVILLDIIMPGMDGYEVCQKLKADKKLADIPVVFVTALKDTKENRIRALEFGGEAFLTKPIDEIELTAQIRAMLKIRNANLQMRDEKEHLAALVAEQTRELNKTHISTLNLLEDLKKEMRDRKQVEEELQASKDYLSNIINAIGDPVFVKDDEYRFVLANDSLCEILGIERENIIGKILGESLPDDQMNHFLEIDKMVLESGQENMSEELLTVTGGKTLTIITKKTRYIDVQGNRFIVGAIRDITERKQIEKELKDSEEHLRKSILKAPYPIMIHAEGDIIGLSNSWTKLTGYDLDEISTIEKWTQLAYGNNATPSKEFIDHIYDLEDLQDDGEWEVRTKDGSSRLWAFSSSPLGRLSDGRRAVISMAVDITERKQAEEKIRKKDIQFRKLSSNVPDLIFQFTRRLDGSFCVPVASEGIKNIFGCSPEDVLEDFTPISKVIYPEDAERVINDIEYSAKHLTFFTCEFRVQIPGKAIQWILSRSTPEKLDDGSITWYGFNADITLNKQAEKEIAASLLEAKQANQVKDQFIANISHEIRTPLNSIIGFSDLFRQRYGDLVNIKDKDIFDYITNSSNRLMRTVDSILNISQLDAGVIKIQPKELDLNTIIKAVIGEIKALADKKGLELTCSPTDEYAMVSVDNYCVHQAILNLVDNAIKYTNDGKVELKLTQKKDSFRLSIQDTGIGISKEYQKRIFDPYTQESEGFTKNFQGIGLGLALTKRYLDLNGVDFELKSEKNVGTTFTLIFPKYEGHEHA